MEGLAIGNCISQSLYSYLEVGPAFVQKGQVSWMEVYTNQAIVASLVPQYITCNSELGIICLPLWNFWSGRKSLSLFVCYVYCFIRCETASSVSIPVPWNNFWSSSDNCSVVYFTTVFMESVTPQTWTLFYKIRLGWHFLSLTVIVTYNIAWTGISTTYNQ